MKNKKLNPAAYVIKQFGGIRPTATALGRFPSAVHGWNKRRQLPMAICKKILVIADKNRMSITAENLIFGG